MKTHCFALLFVLFFVSICQANGADLKSKNEILSADPLAMMGDFSSAELLRILYLAGDMTDVKSYPTLRNVIARQLVAGNKAVFDKEWDRPTADFFRSMKDNREFLETFLTAIRPEYDDLPAALIQMKRLCLEHPDQVRQYPGLAIASAIVWDQPDSSGFADDSRSQYKATPPKNVCTFLDNFLFYADPKHPAASQLKALPWEMLVYVVSNKRSTEERRWVLEQYVKDGKIVADAPDKAYKDVPYNNGEAAKPREEPALDGKEYSLENIRKFGGVCTAQTDYAIPVARTLGIPMFFGGAGFPRYRDGHAWVMWLDFRNIHSDKIDFEFHESGRGDSGIRVAGYESPQTGRMETDEELKLRFLRLGKNPTAFRHATLLMRCYRTLAETAKFTTEQKVEWLLKINELAPRNIEVWREIATLGKNRHFTLQHQQLILDLANRMREDLIDFPNELPGLTLKLVDFPEIREGHWDGYRWKVFEPLFKAAWAGKRPDIVFATTIDFNRLRTAGIRDKSGFEVPTDVHTRQLYDRADRQTVDNALFMLKNLFHNYPGEIDMMDDVFDEMEATAGIGNFGLEKNVDYCYGEFAKRLTSDLSKLPIDYRRSVFKRIRNYARLHDFPKRADEMTELLDKIDKEDNESGKPK